MTREELDFYLGVPGADIPECPVCGAELLWELDGPTFCLHCEGMDEEAA